MALNETAIKHSNYLKLLKKAKGKKQLVLLKNSSSEQILLLVEIILNLLEFRLPLSKQQRSKLLVYSAALRKIAKTKSEKSARRLLIQYGSGPGFIAAVLGPIIFELAREAIKKI